MKPDPEIDAILSMSPEERARRNKKIDSRLLNKRKKNINSKSITIIAPALTLGAQMDSERTRRIHEWKLKRIKKWL